MGTAINMSNYELDLNAMDEEYGEEIMFSGWNPTVALCQHDHTMVDLAIVDADQFLHEICD